MTKLFSFVLVILFSVQAVSAQDGMSISQKLEAKSKAEVEKDPAPGMAILVQHKGRNLLSKGYGLANVEFDIPVKEETIFRLGSITKQFTSAAVMQLIEAGKLTLDTKISDVLTDYPSPGKVVTVHQLLNHTSGIPSYTGLGAEFWSKATMNLTNDELLSMFNDDPLEFEPGTKMSYNNSGYYLLGMIIAEASGMSYEKYLQTNIFEALDLENTSYCRENYIIPNRAQGYEMKAGELVNDENIGMSNPHSAGALCSTIGDLAKWTHALHNGKVVNNSSFEKMTTKTKLADGSEEGYGYGLSIGDNKAGRYVAHGGGINGFSTMLSYFPDEDLLVGVLANSGSARAGDIGGKLAMIALDKEPKPVVKKENPADAALQKYVGKYQAGPGILDMRVENGVLIGQPEGQNSEELQFVSESEFNVPGIEGRVVFEFDDMGEVTQFTLHMNGQEQLATRIKDDKDSETNAAGAVWEHPEEIKVDERVTNEYIGVYELAPGFSLTISKKEGQLMAQGTGQGANPIFASSEKSFFLKAVEATLDFTANDKGLITGLTLHQGGRDISGRKVN